eukprot:COSAG06_NODE_17371_length_945_cov_1.479905_2_plen_155_part_00
MIILGIKRRKRYAFSYLIELRDLQHACSTPNKITHTRVSFELLNATHDAINCPDRLWFVVARGVSIGNCAAFAFEFSDETNSTIICQDRLGTAAFCLVCGAYLSAPGRGPIRTPSLPSTPPSPLGCEPAKNKQTATAVLFSCAFPLMFVLSLSW